MVVIDISKNYEEQQKEEMRVTKYFYEKIGKETIKFLNIKGEYPDCYVEVDNKKIAIELRRYYNQHTTKESQNLRNMIKNWIRKDDNILKTFTNRISKPLCQKQTIYYKNIESMINDILEISNNIDEVDINVKYIYWKEIINNTNHTLPEEVTKKKIITLKEYLDHMRNFILDGEDINLILTCKKNIKISIDVKYDKERINKNDKEIHDWDVWFEDKNEAFKNILEAIKDKIKKYEEMYSTSPIIEEYDEYNLIIYSGDIPPSLNQEEIHELEKYIRENVSNFGFQKIIILVFNKILIMSEDTKFTIIN